MSKFDDFNKFSEFPKIARWNREIVITEKLDGTNAAVRVMQIGEDEPATEVEKFEVLVTAGQAVRVDMDQNGKPVSRYIRAQSRNIFISPAREKKQSDNYGFAAWVFDNAEELAQLGMGKHYGEWWGYGINRGYALPQGDRRFSLFNVNRFNDNRPACCDVVPTLYRGSMIMPGGEAASEFVMRRLRYAGSEASPGFKDPEGIAIYHSAGNVLFKYTTGPEEVGGKERAA